MTRSAVGRPLSRRSVLGGLAVGATAAALPAQPARADDRPAPLVVTGSHPDRRLTGLFDGYADGGPERSHWTGADSAYSVALPDGRTAWLYSDTFLGTVAPDGSRAADTPFVHNSVVLQSRSGDRLRTVTGGTVEAPASLAVAGEESSTWYWVGDGTLEGRQLRILLLHFDKTGTGTFDFAFRGNAVASLPWADLHRPGAPRVTVAPLPTPLTVQWGSAILETARWTYVYGVEDLGADKYLHLARVPAGRLTTACWQYAADRGWSDDPADSRRITAGVGNELSVQRHGRGVLLVGHDTTEALSARVVGRTAPAPQGPFGDPTLLFTTPETGSGDGNVFTYNAKAHPQLGRRHGDRSRLLVTYNVNTFTGSDLYADASIYRPRYVDVGLRC